MSEATIDQLIELSEALETRRVLEICKAVHALRPDDAMWQLACEEIFYRATGEQWHMDEDATRFAGTTEWTKEGIPLPAPPAEAPKEQP